MERIRVLVPFRAAIGTMGQVSLHFDDHGRQPSSKASLSIDLGVGAAGRPVTASLDVAAMRQLVDGLMDAILAVERRQRLNGLPTAV